MAFKRIASRYVVKIAGGDVIETHETLYGAIALAVDAWKASRGELHVFDTHADEQHLVTVYDDGTLSMSVRAVVRVYGIRP